jgi:hypothetical protein
VTDMLDRIDAALAGECPCGVPPRPGSPYCSYDCEPTNLAPDGAEHPPTEMRWRPDLVTAASDDGLEPVGEVPRPLRYAGSYNPTVFRRTGSDMWHLRLDDGHRHVGIDVAEIDPDTMAEAEVADRVSAAYRALERELRNSRHAVPSPAGRRLEVSVHLHDDGRITVVGLAEGPTLDQLLVWVRANGLDPERIPMGAMTTISGDRIETRYSVRDENGGCQLDSEGRGMTRPHIVPLVEPFPDPATLGPSVVVARFVDPFRFVQHQPAPAGHLFRAAGDQHSVCSPQVRYPFTPSRDTAITGVIDHATGATLPPDTITVLREDGTPVEVGEGGYRLEAGRTYTICYELGTSGRRDRHSGHASEPPADSREQALAHIHGRNTGPVTSQRPPRRIEPRGTR